MILHRFLDRHPKKYCGVMLSLLVLGVVSMGIGLLRVPFFFREDRVLPVPGEYEIALARPGHYALWHGQQTQDEALLAAARIAGEIRYPDGVTVRIHGKDSGARILPGGFVLGWEEPLPGTREFPTAFDVRFDRVESYQVSVTRAGGPPRFPTEIFLQRRLSSGVRDVLVGLGIAGVVGSLVLGAAARKGMPRPN
jgi:hypothetical protein